MKLLLLATLFFSHFAFSQTAPNDWRLTLRQAKAMIQYYSDCRGDCFTSTARADTAKENFVRALYPNAKSFTWVNARYRSDDVSRYASRNWELARKGGADVAGYTTQIFRVIDSDDQAYYFDIASICPPPSLCGDSQ